jgi:uncharacterized protein YegL
MEGEPIDTLNNALTELHQAISVNPKVADKAHFGVIGFDSSARVHLALTDLTDVVRIPMLVAQGTTNYTAAFDLLHDIIEEDVRRLKALQHTVHRPVVFFLSDGWPTDAEGELDTTGYWAAARDAVVSPDFPAHPVIIAFGIGNCDAEIVRYVATLKAFIQNDDALSPANALREFAGSLTNSIIQSVNRNDVMADPQLYVQDTVPGFTAIPLETL